MNNILTVLKKGDAMKFLSLRTLTNVLIVVGLMIGQAQAAVTPQEVVQKTIDTMIGRIKEEQPFYKTQPERMTKAVDEILSPIVDIDRIAKLVMAKYYKQATPEQQKYFTAVFKQSLMQTYAKGIANYDDNKIEILPPRNGEVIDPEGTPVRMKIFLKDKSAVDVIYTMFQNPASEWKLQNVTINGINLGLTFRNQFNESMQVNHGDIDKVIAGWSSEVKTDKQNTTASANAK
jgi:phospholipid transport system substrate-binding protein